MGVLVGLAPGQLGIRGWKRIVKSKTGASRKGGKFGKKDR